MEIKNVIGEIKMNRKIKRWGWRKISQKLEEQQQQKKNKKLRTGEK